MSRILATPAAKRIAKEKKIELINIVPSSKDGILRQKDVIGFDQVFTQKITPLAFKMAKVNKLDLADIIGSGHNGKVMKADVLNAIGQPLQKANVSEVADVSIVSATQSLEAKPTKDETKVKLTPNLSLREGDGLRREPMNPMRKVIARRMSESYFVVPAVYINNEVDMTDLLELRQSLIPTIEEETGYRLSVGDLISLAVIKSHKKHPGVNASIDVEKQEIIYHDYVNLAIAVGLEQGLLTPVINNADSLSLKQYIMVSKPLIKAATTGKISSDQLQGSTFTISNLGMYDTDTFTPIINLPNAAILGVNATKKKVVVVNDEMVIRSMMNLSLTMDHRVIDGLEGARFLQTLKGYLENPLSLIV
jgi:pyruvate dehydrogenase E2 component (dihydrolipoamide acetyltransferase)